MKNKSLLISLSFIIYCLNSFAQAPNWDWAHCAGASQGGAMYATATDDTGNVYITGSYNSATFTLGSFTINNAGAVGTQDFFIAKYDPNGIVLWVKRAGGTGDEAGKGITIDPNGNIYVAGNFSSPTVTFGSAPFLSNAGSGNGDLFVVKYNPSGTVLWSRGSGGTGDDKSACITTDSNGNVFFAGQFAASYMFGPTTLVNSGLVDFFVAKYDGSGNAIWAAYGGGSNADWSTGIATDIAGDVYTMGITGSTSMTVGTFTIFKSGYQDIFVSKFDTAGNAVWLKRAGGNTTSFTYSGGIANDHLGNVVATGWFNGTTLTVGSFVLNGNGVFTAKYAANGNVTWAKSDTGSATSRGVACDIYGNSYITGGFATTPIVFGSTTLYNSGSNNYPDVFVVRFDPSGNIIWARSAGGVDTDYGMGISTNTNVVHVVGTFGSSGSVFDTTILSTSNVFIARLSPATPLSIPELNTGSQLSFYPNPSSGVFYLNNNYTKEEISFITVYNCIGEKVYEQGFGASSTSRASVTSTATEAAIDLTKAAAGIYFYSVGLKDGAVARGKLVKE